MGSKLRSLWPVLLAAAIVVAAGWMVYAVWRSPQRINLATFWGFVAGVVALAVPGITWAWRARTGQRSEALVQLNGGKAVEAMDSRNHVAGHAFISYVREDSHQVDQLQRTLLEAGIPVWRDTADLWPGEDWRAKIRSAITDNALVFIACFSERSLARHRSYQNEELVLAIEQLRLRSPEQPWLIPVRFDEVEIPNRDIGGGRTLRSIQRVDLFGDRSEDGAARLVAAVMRILGQQSDANTGDAPEQRTGAQQLAKDQERMRSSSVPSADTSDQLGHSQAFVRPAGINAMVGLVSVAIGSIAFAGWIFIQHDRGGWWNAFRVILAVITIFSVFVVPIFLILDGVREKRGSRQLASTDHPSVNRRALLVTVGVGVITLSAGFILGDEVFGGGRIVKEYLYPPASTVPPTTPP